MSDASEDLFYFNGVDASGGGYLLEPIATERMVEIALGRSADTDHLRELESRARTKDESHFGVKHGVDAAKLEEAGWGVIFAASKDPEVVRQQAEIREALSPLLELRKAQAGDRYKEYAGAQGYRPGESKQKFLARLGAAPGPADPEVVPYYLLIVGPPGDVPFHVQYQIDVQYAVGRVDFDSLDEYANYARAVVEADTYGVPHPRTLSFVAVANPDDAATTLSRKHLVAPLADMAARWPEAKDWTLTRLYDDAADKARVLALYHEQAPALLFTASHGMGFPKGDPLQRRHQGALLLQDWPGPKQWGQRPIGQELYLCGDDLRSDAARLPAIAFNFACYGGGTPEFDEFSKQAFKQRKAIADASFTAGLHRKSLGHPRGGALAAIGHVERAWGYSFMWGTGRRGAQEAQLAVFQSTMEALMGGMRIGAAIEYFNERYAEMASDLSLLIEEAEYEDVDPYEVVNAWTSSNDARGYAVMGDPAVRLQFADPNLVRERIEVPTAPAPAPAPAAPATDAAPASPDADAPASAAVEFGLFGRKKDEDDIVEIDVDEDDEHPRPREEPGVIGRMIDKLTTTLGKVLEDATTLEVRTYVSGNPGLAAAVDRKTLGEEGDLRAFTRIALDGDMDIIIPQRDGVLDKDLWELHLQMVKQAQEARARTLEVIVTAFTGAGKR